MYFIPSFSAKRLVRLAFSKVQTMRRGFVASTPRATGGLWKFQRSGIKITSFFSHSWDKPWRLAWHLKISPWKKSGSFWNPFPWRVSYKREMFEYFRFVFLFLSVFSPKYDSITILLLLSCSRICRRYTLHIYIYIHHTLYIGFIQHPTWLNVYSTFFFR